MPATLLKRGSDTGVFLWILRNIQEHLLNRTPPVALSLWYLYSVSVYAKVDFGV